MNWSKVVTWSWVASLVVYLGVLAFAGYVFLVDRNTPTTFVIAYTNEKGEFEIIKHSAHSYTMSFGCATFDDMSTVCRIIIITPEYEE